LIVGFPLPGGDAAGFCGHLGPHWRCFNVAAGTDTTVGPGEHLGIHRIDIPLIVHDPVAALAPLLAPPFPVGETIGIEVELNSNHGAIGSLSITAAGSHNFQKVSFELWSLQLTLVRALESVARSSTNRLAALFLRYLSPYCPEFTPIASSLA
jgi:hypothetical protein